LLVSERVVPARLKRLGFAFQHEALGDALASIL
jgi:NAD dependent epimerase/dehydratase family enzyme